MRNSSKHEIKSKREVSRLILVLLLVLAGRAYADDMTKGRELYLQNCLACHGQSGLGDGPASAAMKDIKPRNFVEEKFKYGGTFEEIMKTVERGVPGTPMPPWKSIPLKERKLIVRYIMSLKKPAK